MNNSQRFWWWYNRADKKDKGDVGPVAQVDEATDDKEPNCLEKSEEGQPLREKENPAGRYLDEIDIID